MMVIMWSLGGLIGFTFIGMEWVMVMLSGMVFGMGIILSGLGSGNWLLISGYLGFDKMGLMLSSLSLWICMLSMMVSKVYDDKFCKILIMMIILFLVMCFGSWNSLIFYIFFEVILVPLYLLILMYGDQSERIESGMFMLFYTIFGSLPLLIMIFGISGMVGSWSFVMLLVSGKSVKMGFFLIGAFMIKLPIYGMHLWLPKAHVESPVSGSMILAGILLKLGGYGIYRMLNNLELSEYVEGMLIILGLYGGFVCGLICLRQVDMKKLVAYSSVVHMGLFLGSAMINQMIGWKGGMMMMSSHGFCSSGLFYLVGLIYERMKTRSLMLVKGSLGVDFGMMMWCFLLLAMNMAVPPFLSIFSEINMMIGLLKYCPMFMLLMMLLFFVSVSYNIYMYSSLSQGKGSLIVWEGIKISEYLVMSLHVIPMGSMVMKMDLISWF